MKAGCDHFMHSKLVPGWGCRCCNTTSDLKKHNYWDVYSRSNDNNEGDSVSDPKKEEPKKEEPKKEEPKDEESDKSDNYSLAKSKMSCEGRNQGKYLGVFQTA